MTFTGYGGLPAGHCIPCKAMFESENGDRYPILVEVRIQVKTAAQIADPIRRPTVVD